MIARDPLEIIQKAWGHEVCIVNNDTYCGKILRFNEGSSGSLHYHQDKTETFYLRTGWAYVQVGEDKFIMHPGECIDIPAGTKHQITAISACEFFEFSTPHNDADTFRIIPSKSNAHTNPK